VTAGRFAAFRRRRRPGSVARMTVELVEFTDPGCSYAWGTEPKVRRLRWQYGHRLRWRRVVVGLHPPGWTDGRHDPASPQTLSDYWKGVGAVTGMPFPSPLHHLHTSTEEACRLVGWGAAQVAFDRSVTGVSGLLSAAAARPPAPAGRSPPA